MSAPVPVRERVRVSTGTLVRAVVFTTLALAVFAAVARASRVIEWVAAAAVIAGLLEPAVAFMTRRIRRGLAVAVVVLAGLAVAGLLGYELVEGIRRGADALEATVVEQAQRLEQSERFGEFAQEAELVQRGGRLVDQLTLQLFGEETPAGAVRAAVDRAVSLLVVVVLSIFLLARGPDLSRFTARLPLDEHRRHRLGGAVLAARRRGLGYVRRTLLLAVGAGMLAYALARAAGVPGASALGIWAGLWDLVPVLGSTVGFLPVVLLAAADSWVVALSLLPAIAAFEVLEVLLRRRWVVRGTMHLGSFLTAVALVAGLELAGVFGALVGLAVVAFGAALVDEGVPAWREASPEDRGDPE